MFIYSDTQGKLVRATETREQHEEHGEPEAGTFDPTMTIVIDFKANPGLYEQIYKRWDDFTVSAGKLLDKGVEVTLQPDDDRTLLERFIDGLPDAKVRVLRKGSKEFVDALANSVTPTQTQRDHALGYEIYLRVRGRDDA